MYFFIFQKQPKLACFFISNKKRQIKHHFIEGIDLIQKHFNITKKSAIFLVKYEQFAVASLFLLPLKFSTFHTNHHPYICFLIIIFAVLSAFLLFYYYNNKRE